MQVEIVSIRSSVLGLVACAFLPALALSSCDVTCDEDSDGVLYARSLSQERLARLYYDMERFSTNDSVPANGYDSLIKSAAYPREFSDLEVAKIRPEDANIMVQGCFDHYVYLHFQGYGRLQELYPERRIVLSWGEHDETSGTEVLWREAASDR